MYLPVKASGSTSHLTVLGEKEMACLVIAPQQQMQERPGIAAKRSRKLPSCTVPASLLAAPEREHFLFLRGDVPSAFPT